MLVMVVLCEVADSEVGEILKEYDAFSFGLLSTFVWKPTH